MAKAKTVYVCQQCGSQQVRWAGRCPECQEWNSLAEERVVPEPVRDQPAFAAGEATPITEVESVDSPRVLTGIGEFDRILGGGAVLGSITNNEGRITRITRDSHLLENNEGQSPIISLGIIQ